MTTTYPINFSVPHIHVNIDVNITELNETEVLVTKTFPGFGDETMVIQETETKAYVEDALANAIESFAEV